MSRELDDLDPAVRPNFDKFLAEATEANIPLMIIDVLRTPEQQAINIRNRVSWTFHSKHLPQQPSGKSRAIDVCPFKVFALYGPDKLLWDARDSTWNKLGDIGEKCGLIWGGRWKQKDLGHFEI